MSSKDKRIKCNFIIPKSANVTSDGLDIEDVDHVELYVGNAKQAAFFYQNTFGFQIIAYRGPETGYRDSVSYCLRQGTVTLVLTSPLLETHESNDIIHRRGDTVRSIALRVSDVESFYYTALSRGATSFYAPYELSSSTSSVKIASIRLYGDTIHTLIERKGNQDNFLPGFKVIQPSNLCSEIGISRIDHIVANVELGEMNTWVKFYESVLGFTEMRHFSDEEISTEYSSLMSKVLRNGNDKIKFPINEPAQGRRKSQIEEFLDYHGGPGVQHIALLTKDIIQTVTTLKGRGVEFLAVPHTYYEELPSRVGAIREDVKKLGELGILADRDDDGYLLQIFTKPVQDKPTLFFEIIQREGAKGFGAGNFKALFEAIEREQEKRGNL